MNEEGEKEEDEKEEDVDALSPEFKLDPIFVKVPCKELNRPKGRISLYEKFQILIRQWMVQNKYLARGKYLANHGGYFFFDYNTLLRTKNLLHVFWISSTIPREDGYSLPNGNTAREPTISALRVVINTESRHSRRRRTFRQNLLHSQSLVRSLYRF